MSASLLALWLALASSAPGQPPEPAPAPASAPAPSSVFELDDAAFLVQAGHDLEELRRYTGALKRLQAQLQKTRGLYLQKQSIPYSLEQKRTLLTTWAAFFDYFMSIEVLRQRYWDFIKVAPTSRPLQHAWGYLLTHLALTTELAHGVPYVELAGGRQQLEVLLDEPSPEYGVPERAFARLKAQVIHVGTTTQLLTGDGYRRTAQALLSKAGALEDKRVVWALQEMRQNGRAVRGKLLKRGATLFASSAADVVQDSAQRAFFPVQRGVAEWMGDTRVHRKGQPLISREQVLALLERMEPGDLIVARQNWYLSNIGLPGFWPHAELYVGPPEQLSASFDGDAGVAAWLATLPGKPRTLAEHLGQAFPQKWAAWQGQDAHGDALRIIESISEGVSFTGPEHGLRVDYLGVMRPRRPKVEKARAIARAFGYQGRPYDFNFDFFSDSTLVCTELVYKAYAPSEGMQGLKVDLVDVAGRRTLPANEWVRLFDQEYERPDRQLDFVAFLDGREGQRAAVEADVQALRASYRRMKWDIAQR